MSPDGDRALWCAVIHQALDDAANPKSDECAEARAFLMDGGEWFATVCQHAGMEPSSVHARAATMLQAAADPIPKAQPRKLKTQVPKVKQPHARRTQPNGKPARTITHDRHTLTIRQWSERLEICVSTITARIKAGRPIATVLSTDRQPNRTPINVNRPVRRLDHDGLSLTVTEWSERVGISAQVIRLRLRDGCSVAQALAPRDPTRPRNNKTPMLITHDGLTLTVNAWADRLGLQAQAIRYRLKAGHPISSVLSRDPLPTGYRVTGWLPPGGGSRLSQVAGDRRGELNAREGRIGDLHP